MKKTTIVILMFVMLFVTSCNVTPRTVKAIEDDLSYYLENECVGYSTADSNRVRGIKIIDEYEDGDTYVYEVEAWVNKEGYIFEECFRLIYENNFSGGRPLSIEPIDKE